MEKKNENSSSPLSTEDVLGFCATLALVKVHFDILQMILADPEKENSGQKPYEMKSSDIKIDNYIITSEKIGEGSYGQVFKAYRAGTSNLFVAKQQEVTKIAESEIMALRFLANKEFVVRLIDVLYKEEKVFTVMEYCNQGSLRDILLKKQTIPEEDAIQIIEYIATLFYLVNKENNGMEIIHRDLKPENLLFHNGQLKIGDWGLAKFHFSFNKGFSTSKDLNKYFAFCGSRDYVSPELESGNHYDSKTDVYSTGIILAECVGIKNLGYPLEDPLFEKFSPRFKYLLQHMLEINPKNRFSWGDICENSPNMLNLGPIFCVKGVKFSFLS